MTKPDVFAFRDSGLNAFLFATVGTELDGSTLTILSVLARLDKDPWTEAAHWALRPRAAAADWLAARIECMPLTPQSLATARETAAHLVQLLPRPGGVKDYAKPARHRWVEQWWVPMALAGLILVMAVATSMTIVPHLASSLVQSSPHSTGAQPR